MAQLVGFDIGPGNGLGASIALSGDTAVVGAPFAPPSGAAYVFVRGTTGWSQQAKLVPPDGALNDRFGAAVAIDADTVAVGNPVAFIDGRQNAGAVYVFVRGGSTWTLQQKLVGAQSGDLLGTSVDVDGNDLAAGEPEGDFGDSVSTGAVQVYTRTGTTWSLAQRLLAASPRTFARLGTAVAIDAGVVVAGAPDDNRPPGQGSVSVFRRSGSSWTQEALLTPLDATAGQQFGIAVDFDGDIVIVGAPQPSVDPPLPTGAAYVFTRTAGQWAQSARLLPIAAAPGSGTGYSVAIAGTTAVVGAPAYGNATLPGSVTAFVRDGNTWREEETLLAAGGLAGSRFGSAVAIERTRAVVGAANASNPPAGRTGAGYVFESAGRIFVDGFE